MVEHWLTNKTRFCINPTTRCVPVRSPYLLDSPLRHKWDTYVNGLMLAFRCSVALLHKAPQRFALGYRRYALHQH